MRYRVNHEQVINEVIDGEPIMINLATGNYYSLDRVGGDVWSLVEAECSVDRVAEELCRRYDASDEEIRTAVDELLSSMAREGLVVPTEEQATASAALEPVEVRQPFVPPRLERFTDMQDLILLDPVHEVDSRGWPHAADPERAAG